MENYKKTFLLFMCLVGLSSRTLILATATATATATNKLYGLHSDELQSGQLVIPQRIDKNGKFLTHNLTHHHTQHYQLHRQRRSLIDEDNTSDMDYLHYRLNLENETLHMELEPHTYFMTPHLIVERHRRDLRTRSKPMRNTNCHYHGKIRGQSDSSIAISTCDGLVGHIRTRHNEYFIEPSKLHSAHPINGHPHVVFQRSSVKPKEQQTVNKAKRKKRKRKQQRQQQQQQQQQQHQRQHQHEGQRSIPVSNCGTREPHRHIETRLEWQTLGKVKIQGGRKIRRHQNHHNHHHQAKHHAAYRQRRQRHRDPHRHHQQQHQQQQQQQREQQRHFHDHRTPAKYEYQTAKDATTLTFPAIKRPPHQPFNDMTQSNSQIGPTTSMMTIDNEASRDSSISSQRTKRSISSPRHVETLIVADKTMTTFHADVVTYLLSIMNVVSSLYKDPSIGNSIEIIVVKIVLLEDADEPLLHLNLTGNAQQNLDTFCGWQHTLNTANENDPHHHDVAILVTRKNICGDNCMTLGLANVGGMCKPKQSCSVNEDNGIMLSHTIAHELGHNFGMFHDTAKIGCFPRIGPIVHIMTPTFGADTLQVRWSNCSRNFITHFLDQGLGECLDDAPVPHDHYNYPDQPPGALFNAELQCRLQFNVTDSNVTVCSSTNEICTALWCRVNGECVTNMRPTAPGTSCGKRKWCQKGKCVRMKELTPVNGGWGNWSEWSKCSRSCGGGVSIQQRECDSPVPENGGLFCIGERKRYKICEQHPCPVNEPSFRAWQCSNFDRVPYQGTTYKWLPFFDKKDPCKLFCTDVDDTVIANWGEVVLDGTPCTLGTNNMCIDGICKKVGCDWIVDSDLEDDRCGICGGKGDQCKPVKEIFDEPLNVTEGYVEIVTIPARARHIIIKELSNSPNFLAISKKSGKPFYLNGDSLISMPGEFIIAGAESLYDRTDEEETINIPQPIEHSIAVYAVVRSTEPTGGIYYEFTLPAVNISEFDIYKWKLSDWTACTATCGGGLQYREALCYKNGKLISTDELCWSFAQNKRPLRLTRSCNEVQCPAHWWVGPWQFCPVTCRSTDALSYPLRRRSVMCLDQNEVVVEDEKCNKLTRPADAEQCEPMPDCKETRGTAEIVSHRNENLVLRFKNL